MGTNADLAKALREIADLLDLSGERFKPEAYRRASRSIESLPEDIRKYAGRGELSTIPGVGEAIAEKTREYLRDNRIEYLERLRQQFPPGIVELMRLPGIGPKTARRFLVELKVEGAAELRSAIDAGRLNGVAGFGERKIELFRQALAAAGPAVRRNSLREAWTIAQGIVEALRKGAPLERIEVAGSLRRRRETVGDLDILVTSTTPEQVFDVFSQLPGVAEVKLRGPTKETVNWEGGVQVDLRVVEPGAFGAALQYFTGSKDHNVHLRGLARDRGLKINEYGVFRGEERVGGATEEEVYQTMGLAWIPPEIREDAGEIDAAAGTLPALLELGHLRGDLHVHLAEDSGRAEWEALLGEARRRHWEYLGVVLPEGKDPAGLPEWMGSPDSAPGEPHVFRVLERPVSSASLTLPAGYDYWIGRSDGPDPPKVPPAVPPFLVGHVPFSGDSGEARADLVGTWIAWAADQGVALEVTPEGPMDGLDAAGVRRSVSKGVAVAVRTGFNTGTPDPSELPVGLARRGWAGPESVLNTRSRSSISEAFRASRGPADEPGRRGRRIGSLPKKNSPR